MSYAQMILPEFDQEMAGMRKVLERIPEDKWDWKAHPKSNTLGWNANHLAEMPGWVSGILGAPSFDIHPAGGKRYESPKVTSRKEVLDLFDRNVAEARKAIESVEDGAVVQMWSLTEGGKPLMTMPRAVAMRSFILNHMIHHRGIVCVYLRLNDIPVPSLYGPSGDE